MCDCEDDFANGLASLVQSGGMGAFEPNCILEPQQELDPFCSVGSRWFTVVPLVDQLNSLNGLKDAETGVER